MMWIRPAWTSLLRLLWVVPVRSLLPGVPWPHPVDAALLRTVPSVISSSGGFTEVPEVLGSGKLAGVVGSRRLLVVAQRDGQWSLAERLRDLRLSHRGGAVTQGRLADVL